LLKSPGTAWRLLIAHAIAASGYWHVKRDPRQARSGENAASVAGSTAQQASTAERQVVLGLLDQPDDASVESSNGDPYRTAVVFARLLALGEDEVLRIAAFVMAETLAAGVPLVEALGIRLKVDDQSPSDANATGNGAGPKKAEGNCSAPSSDGGAISPP
jgi:ParB family transcriptional regulator, chromosome partitioning protein